MKRIKILYFINSLKVGGTEQRVVTLLERLPRDIFDLHLCCLVETGILEKRVKDSGIPIKVLNYKGVRVNGKLSLTRFIQFPSIFYRFYKYLKKEKFDLMNTFLPICNTIGAFIGRSAGVKNIIGTRVCLGEYRDVNPFYQPIENSASKKTDLIICNSKMVYEDVLKREKINPGKLKIIYNGVDAVKFENCDKKSSSDKIRREFNISVKSVIIGIVANLYKYKGLDYFLESAKMVSDKYSDTSFILVGRDSGMLNILKEQAIKSGIDEKVFFTGFRENIPEIISSMDILCLTSFEEGLPNVLLEGMAAGKPIVSTNAGGAVEIVKDNETGFIVPVKDSKAFAEKLMILTNDKELRTKMGMAGLKRVKENFSIDKMITSYADTYISLFKN